MLITIQNHSTPKKNSHLLLVKGKRIEVTRDEMVMIRDEMDFYLEAPPEMDMATGRKQKK